MYHIFEFLFFTLCIFCLVVSNEKPEKCKPEEDLPFMNMLSELGLKDKPIGNAEKPPATDITSSPQTRWSAYLQSRIRAGTSPEVPRSMSLDGYPSVNQDTRGKRTKQRPLSVGCVNELEQRLNPEQLREKWLKEGSHSQRYAIFSPSFSCLKGNTFPRQIYPSVGPNLGTPISFQWHHQINYPDLFTSVAVALR